MLEPTAHMPLILFALISCLLWSPSEVQASADIHYHLKSPLCPLYTLNLSQSAAFPSIPVTAL